MVKKNFTVKETRRTTRAGGRSEMPHLKFDGPSTAKHMAVICGWGGGKLKNVHKYAALWHRLGWRTVTIEMTIDMTFYPSTWTPVGSIAQTIAWECRQQRSSHPDARIVSHAFSNGGTFMKLMIMDEASDPNFFDGTVYDVW